MNESHIPKQHIKGRGSSSRLPGRFAKATVESTDDGWGSDRDGATEAFRPPTTVTEERARTVISRNDSPDVGFSQSVNPFRGCEHGCAYCFARPSHSYLDLSPGLDFETKLFVKSNADALLREELAKPSYRCAPLAVGINTDAYQPIERHYRLTRRCLQVLAEARHPVSFVTKGALIMRDVDLLSTMAREGLVNVFFSITTLDNHLASKMEPRASAPHARLRAMRALADAGVPVGVLVAPIIPAINDSEIECVLQSAREHGAIAAGYALLRLPHELKTLWREWLEIHFPDRATHVMSLIRQMRGGRDYDSTFGKRMSGEGPLAQIIQQRFVKTRSRLGFRRMPPLDVSRFVPPRGSSRQGSLF